MNSHLDQEGGKKGQKRGNKSLHPNPQRKSDPTGKEESSFSNVVLLHPLSLSFLISLSEEEEEEEEEEGEEEREYIVGTGLL